MPDHYLFNLLFLAAVVAASVRVVERASERRNDELSWVPCTNPATNEPVPPLVCAELEVPLDYLDTSSTEKITLKLTKYPAVQEPHLGSILMNFGGPGALGSHVLFKRGESLSHVVGGQHDIVTWDPRGTLETMPFDCGDVSHANKARNLRPHVINKRSPEAEFLNHVWRQRGKLALMCEAKVAREGSLIGTAYSARDMLQIVDALENGEGGLLRYWGFSAGSTLGATFVAMFPDRADRIVIDGVDNVHASTRALGNPEALSSTDSLVTNIIIACTKLPEGCPLAKSTDESVKMIENRLQEALLSLLSKPLTVGDSEDKKELHWAIAQKVFFESLYHPRMYPRLIKCLAALMNKNAAPMLELDRLQTEARPRGSHLNLIEGVKCGDQWVRSTYLYSREGVHTIKGYRAASAWFGRVFSYSLWMICAQWKIDAKERYEGDYKVDTAVKGPGMLIIGNSFDPMTPWASAQNMSETMRNSVLLKHNGHGHTSVAQRSECTENIIRAYFTQGLLPEKDTVCEPNHELVEYLASNVASKAKRDEDSPVWDAEYLFSP